MKLRGISATTVVTTHTLDDDDEFLLLACDGLWDVMEDQEAVDLVRDYVAGNALHEETGNGESGNGSGGRTKRGRMEDVASVLTRESLRRGSTDNVTVIVYWL